MFLNYLKNYFLKYTLKNKWREVVPFSSGLTITSIGILIDEVVFKEKAALIEDLVAKGFQENAISILVYRETINPKIPYPFASYSLESIDWNGNFKDPVVTQFVNKEFDMLISYYNQEKSALLLVTESSKAKFKVGFSSVNKRFNHFMITTAIEEYRVFVNELIKYLRILNKIK